MRPNRSGGASSTPGPALLILVGVVAVGALILTQTASFGGFHPYVIQGGVGGGCGCGG